MTAGTSTITVTDIDNDNDNGNDNNNDNDNDNDNDNYYTTAVTRLNSNSERESSSASTATATKAMPMNPHHQLRPSFRRPRRICLFGTSANPPTGTGGHAGVVRALVELQKFDEVRVLPVYRHTFAAKRHQLLGFDHRVAMCQLAVEDAGGPKEVDAESSSSSQSQSCDGPVATKVVVSRAEEASFHRLLASSDAETDEEKASMRVGTADLLEMLLEDENGNGNGNGNASVSPTKPTTEFSFCLGADTFMDLTDWKWKRSRDVLKFLEGRLVVIHRKQEASRDPPTPTPTATASDDVLRDRIDELNKTPLVNGKIVLLDIPSLGDVSSSQVRNASNKDLVTHMLSPRVLDYIVANNLYGFGESKS